MATKAKIRSFADSFNDGDPIKITEGGAVLTEDRLLKITLVKVIPNKFNSDQFQYEIWVEDQETKEDTILWQPVFINDNGELNSPLFPGYTKKDGTEVFPSPLYEFTEAAKGFMGKDEVENRLKECTGEDGSVAWKRFFIGLEFMFECKGGKKKDGDGRFLIVMTKRNKKKEEDYFAKKNEDNSDMFIGNVDLAERSVKNRKNSTPVEVESDTLDDLPF